LAERAATRFDRDVGLRVIVGVALETRPEFSKRFEFVDGEISATSERSVQYGADMRVRENDTIAIRCRTRFWGDVRDVKVEGGKDVGHAERTCGVTGASCDERCDDVLTNVIRRAFE
jgi:hypothetical protein